MAKHKLITQQQAAVLTGWSVMTIKRACIIYRGNCHSCGCRNGIGLKSYRRNRTSVNLIRVSDLRAWDKSRRQRGAQPGYNHPLPRRKKKRSQSAHKNGDQARERRTNESARR